MHTPFEKKSDAFAPNQAGRQRIFFFDRVGPTQWGNSKISALPTSVPRARTFENRPKTAHFPIFPHLPGEKTSPKIFIVMGGGGEGAGEASLLPLPSPVLNDALTPNTNYSDVSFTFFTVNSYDCAIATTIFLCFLNNTSLFFLALFLLFPNALPIIWMNQMK